MGLSRVFVERPRNHTYTPLLLSCLCLPLPLWPLLPGRPSCLQWLCTAIGQSGTAISIEQPVIEHVFAS
jgi:hypothetical protein